MKYAEGLGTPRYLYPSKHLCNVMKYATKGSIPASSLLIGSGDEEHKNVHFFIKEMSDEEGKWSDVVAAVREHLKKRVTEVFDSSVDNLSCE